MNILRISGLCLCGLLLTVSFVSGATLKIATIAPEGSYWITEMRKAAQTIKQRTDGRVKFKFYPGGVMGGENNVLRKIRLGQLHGGMFTGGGLEPVYSDIRLYSLPLLFNDLNEVDYVRERLDGPLRAGLEKAGFVSFGFAEGGFAQMMSKTPIHETEQMNGHKVWVPEGDRVYYESMSAIGLAPVPLPITDVLTGLQTGLVEIVATSPVGALVFQWQTKISYLTTTPLSYVMGIFAIDKRAYKKIKPDDQRVIREIMEPLFVTFDRRTRIDNREALEVLRAQGIKIIEQTPEAKSDLRKRTRKAIETLSKEGFFDPELLRQLEAHLADYRKSKD